MKKKILRSLLLLGIIVGAFFEAQAQEVLTRVNGGTSWETPSDNNGIYSGDGTAPSDVDVTVTDNIDFDAGTLYIDGSNDRVGIGVGTTAPIANLHLLSTSASSSVVNGLYRATQKYSENTITTNSSSHWITSNQDVITLTPTGTSRGYIGRIVEMSIPSTVSSNLSNSSYVSISGLTYASTGTASSLTGSSGYVNIGVGSGTVSTVRGVSGSVSVSEDAGNAAGVSGETTLGGSITLSRAEGIIGKINLSSATTTSSAGIRSAVDLTGASVNTDVYGLKIDDFQGNGASTTTNTYGVYVGDLTEGTQTNTPYSIYTADNNANSRIAGNLVVGTSTSPESTLDVDGSVSKPIVIVGSITTFSLGDAHHTVVLNANANASLPTASSCEGRVYQIINRTSGARTISSYQGISGSASTSIPANSSITVQSDGTNWWQVR